MHQYDIEDEQDRDEILRKHAEVLKSVTKTDALLSVEEERALSWGMKVLRYLMEIGTADGTCEIAWIRSLVGTKQVLGEKNLGLVGKIVNDLVHDPNDGEMRVSTDVRDECIQCGRLGLMQAIDRFDVGFGTRLSTFAWKYIKGHVVKYLQSAFGNDIPVPDPDPVPDPGPNEIPEHFVRLQLSGDSLLLLARSLPAIVSKSYSNAIRREIFSEFRQTYQRWNDSSPGLRAAAKARRLDALGEMVGKDRKQVGESVGEYSVPLSELIRRVGNDHFTQAEKDEAQTKLNLYLSAVASSVVGEYHQPDLADEFAEYLLDALHTPGHDCTPFHDALPRYTKEFLQRHNIDIERHECWHWRPRHWDNAVAQVGSKAGAKADRTQKQRHSDERKVLQQNTPTQCVIECGSQFQSDPVKIGTRRVNGWPQNWKEVFECKAEDFKSLEDAHVFSFAIGWDPGNWPVPEPSEAFAEILAAAVNTVHSCVCPTVAGDRVPLDASIPEDSDAYDEYGLGAKTDQYWGDVFECALTLLRDGLLSQQLTDFGILKGD